MSVRYEIQVNAVPRSYRDVLQVAIESAQFLKMRNIKEEVIVLDMVTQKRALIVDDHSEPVWREPLAGPMVKPASG
jgi:hypothetical protein